MLNPFIVGVLAQLIENDEDLELMSRPMEEWTEEEMVRMAKKTEAIFGIK